MERLLGDAVLPYLRGRLGAGGMVIKARTLHTVGLGESWIDERIDPQMRSANPTVGLAAHSGIVDIRITARAEDAAAADVMIAGMEAQVRAAIGDVSIFGAGDEKLEQVTADLLAQAEVTLAIVESATGGEVARLLRAADRGAGVVADARVVDGPEALAAQLGLSPAKLAAFGWVSEMSAAEAAATLIDTYEGGWGLAILGDLHVSGDVYGEEIGQTFVALGAPDATIVQRFPYGGSGVLARRWVTLRVLDLLRRQAIARLEARR